MAASDPVLSSRAHESNHRTVKKLREGKDRIRLSEERCATKQVKQNDSAARRRALRNWARARQAVKRNVTKDMLGSHRRQAQILPSDRALSSVIRTYC